MEVVDKEGGRRRGARELYNVEIVAEWCGCVEVGRQGSRGLFDV